MKKNLNLYKGMRPAAVMLLCTCIAFSAVMPYVPPALPAAAEESSTEAERPSGNGDRREQRNGCRHG
ncbi:MAG: hypothetical protein E7B18_03870 [Clostridium sp.]|nr:hypothetical protein [Clostridium sp.]